MGAAIRFTEMDEDRFWAKVTIPADVLSGCWEYSSLTTNGYGQFGYGGRHPNRAVKLAHRVAFGLVRGPVPDDMHVCHHCDNRACVNPSHLFLGTDLDNVRDMDAKGRRVNTPTRGAANTHAKLTDEKVREIRRRYPSETQAALAREFGVSAPTISSIIRRKMWAHVKEGD
jgi:hypothetical protein